MAGSSEFLADIRRSTSRRILFLPHALRQMARPERMISTNEVRGILESGEIVEDYPEDARGHSALLLGSGEGGRAVHVVCSPKPDYVAVITAYLPDPGEWSSDYKERKRE